MHAYQNFGEQTARMILHVSPGANFDDFFAALSAHNQPLPEPDLPGSAKIMSDFGIEMCGPPLAQG